jgi:hypothetical protein
MSRGTALWTSLWTKLWKGRRSRGTAGGGLVENYLTPVEIVGLTSQNGHPRTVEEKKLRSHAD